jgi:hypothetical protein
MPELPSGYVCKLYLKHKQISCLDFGLIPYISHYVCANISKSGGKKRDIQNSSNP